MAITRSTKFFIFHEIKIPNNYLIFWSQHFSWDQNSKEALLGNFDLMNDLLVTSTIMRLKFANNAFLNFDLMNDLLAASTIMRLKLFKFIKLDLWLILALIISHLCVKTFDLMIALVTNNCSWDWNSLKILFWVLISWSICQSQEHSWDQN